MTDRPRLKPSELTLTEILDRQAEAAPDQAFAIFPEASITFAQLRVRARMLALGLIADGLKPRDHVAILMPNCLEFLVAHFAVQYAGGISVLLNARSKQTELRYAIPHGDATLLLTTDSIDTHVNFTDILSEAFPALADASCENLSLVDAPRLRRIILFGRKHWPAAANVDRFMAAGGALVEEALGGRAGTDPEETAVMIYTSGTTAAPKACELSHASLQRSWAIYSRTVSLVRGAKVWDPMPFFHSGGIGLMTGIMACGASIVTSAHFDAEVIVGLIERHRIEHLYPGFHLLGLPIIQSPKYDKTRFEFVRTMVVIGPQGTVRWIQRQLPDHARVLNLFGMSEGSGLVTLTPLDCEEDLRLTVSGKASHGVELRIVSDDTGTILPRGQTGEIQFRGGGAFRGYYKDSRTTRETILEGEWIRTGDLGRIDEQGWLTYLGRLKDVLRTGGESVAMAEIESFLSAHPGVRFVQVIGKPDERLGEVPVAFVERNPDSDMGAQDLIDFCRDRIARYKVPREVHFVTEWPMSATKIQKAKLRELLMELSPSAVNGARPDER
jgi:fatty-acyl-CoA synthase